MPATTFEIDVTRKGVSFATITVEADSLSEAEHRALEEAGNHDDYSEKYSEYELTRRAGDADAAQQRQSAPAALDGLSVHQLLQEVRRRGHVVCAWGPQDLIDTDRATSKADALEALAQARSSLEDRMTEIGWNVIDALPQREPQYENGITVTIEMEPGKYEVCKAAFCDSSGAAHELDPVAIDEDVMTAGRCVVGRVLLRNAGLLELESPAMTTDRGAREFLKEAGFFVRDGLQLEMMPTDALAPPMFVITFRAPQEILPDVDVDTETFVRPRETGSGG